MEKQSFICPSCGNIIEADSSSIDKILKRDYLCTCNTSIFIAHSYPFLSANDFAQSAQELFSSCKEIDKQNLHDLFDFLKEEFSDLDKSQLDKYINIYEKIKEKFSDNTPQFFTAISDEFEEKLRSKIPIDLIDAITSTIISFNKNKLRKPLVIIIASVIEQLFNDYFSMLVHSKLSPNGAPKFLSEYARAPISTCITISNTFLETDLKTKMDTHSKGFFDRWSTLRDLRNSIIHGNDKFISKTKLSQLYKLVDESIKVFMYLKSELYANNDLRSI